MRFVHKFDILRYTLLLKIQINKKLDVRTAGMESRVSGTCLHVIFLDFDNTVDERLKEELQYLQEVFEIGNFYVFWTREDGRHAVCIDALRFTDSKEIVDFSSCDLKFKYAPRINEYTTWVLRLEGKGKRDAPKYLYTVESPHEGKNPQSRGHAKFLEKFGLKIDLKNPVGTEELLVQDYSTRSKPDKEEDEKDE